MIKKKWMIFVTMIGLLSFLIVFILFIQLIVKGKVNLINRIITTIPLWMGMLFVHNFIIEIKNKYAYFKKHKIVCHIFQVALFLVVVFIVAILFVILQQGEFPQKSFLIITKFPVYLTSSIIINFFSFLIVAVFSQYIDSKRQEMELQRLQTKNMTYHYAQLKEQINPHFLFNSLNVLVSLINKNPDLAIHYTKLLSNIYRYVLMNETKDTVTLNEELEFIKHYLGLLKIRFNDGLDIHVDVEKDTLSKEIIPMALQLLIENAVKHNSISPSSPLIIKINCHNGYVIVSNSIQKRTHMIDSTGIGLKNLEERYDIFFSKQIEILNDGVLFSVKIPLL